MSNTPLELPTPTIQEIEVAHRAFEGSEPRDLFYRAATELMSLALRGETSLSVTEALAVLLQTWNRAFYRFTPFDSQHFADLERVVTTNQRALATLRERSIERFSSEDSATVERLFGNFEKVLGPVGAAKALHLLAPQFFPLWDRAIAKAYTLALRKRGKNAERYRQFMVITKRQYEALAREHSTRQNLLKLLDEYNYTHYTKHWT
jgi:hypothetical protein